MTLKTKTPISVCYFARKYNFHFHFSQVFVLSLCINQLMCSYHYNFMKISSQHFCLYILLQLSLLKILLELPFLGFAIRFVPSIFFLSPLEVCVSFFSPTSITSLLINILFLTFNMCAFNFLEN